MEIPDAPANALLLFPGRCAETTAVKQLLSLLAQTLVLISDKGLDVDELRHLRQGDGAQPASRFVQITPAIVGAIQNVVTGDTSSKTSFSVPSMGVA
jgi:hypothetical protein